MAYKTILVHIDQSRQAPERLRIAVALALAEDAHLVGTALSGVSAAMYLSDANDLSGDTLTRRIDGQMERARAALAQFDAIAQAAGLRSYESRLVNDDPQGGLSLQARYSDLVVLSQTELDGARTGLVPNVPEYVVLNSARPVLIVPHSGTFASVGKRALVAWDGSMESTRALTNAIPLLRRADNVALALFNPSKRDGVHGEQPGADIALVLARHGVKVEVLPRYTDIDIGNALLSMATDLDSDLIVMGGYGHSRFREMLLGGVTKTVLQTMTVPVLMSH